MKKRITQLKRSKAGLIGAMTKLRVRGKFWPLLTEGERNLTSVDLAAKLESYDEVWRKFVNAHECFMEIMAFIEPEKRRA